MIHKITNKKDVKAVKLAAKFLSKDQTREVLLHFHAEKRDGKQFLIATDGRKMAVVSLVMRLLDGEYLPYSLGSTPMLIRSEGMVYPKWERVLPGDENRFTFVATSRADLLFRSAMLGVQLMPENVPIDCACTVHVATTYDPALIEVGDDRFVIMPMRIDEWDEDFKRVQHEAKQRMMLATIGDRL